MKFLRHLNQREAKRPMTERQQEVARRKVKARLERQFAAVHGFPEKIGRGGFHYE